MSATAWTAVANPLFPDRFRDELRTPCAPDCPLCHGSEQGGFNNRRPGSIIGTWTANYQLDGLDPDSVITAFAEAEADKSDTDHDGVPDTEELLSGSDPDDPTPGAKYACRVEPPVYGCLRVARHAPVDDVAALAGACAAVIGFAALRRRIARRRAR